MRLNHYEIKPIDCLVKSSFLYQNNDIDKNSYEKGKIISLCLYKGEAITFDVLLENGSLFNYVGLTEVKLPRYSSLHTFSLKELVYHNSLSIDITIQELNYLKNKHVYYFNKYNNEWYEAKYILTVDWYTENDLMHLLVLETGNFVFAPNHKILFLDEPKFKKDLSFCEYKKIRNEYMIEKGE